MSEKNKDDYLDYESADDLEQADKNSARIRKAAKARKLNLKKEKTPEDGKKKKSRNRRIS